MAWVCKKFFFQSSLVQLEKVWLKVKMKLKLKRTEKCWKHNFFTFLDEIFDAPAKILQVIGSSDNQIKPLII